MSQNINKEKIILKHLESLISQGAKLIEGKSMYNPTTGSMHRVQPYEVVNKKKYTRWRVYLRALFLENYSGTKIEEELFKDLSSERVTNVENAICVLNGLTKYLEKNIELNSELSE